MSELVTTSQQSADLEITQKSATFLIALQDLNRRLGVLYQLIVPLLFRRSTDYTEAECERIELLINTVTQYLGLAKELMDVSVLVEPYLEPIQCARMKELLAVMEIWGAEMESAVGWMKEALAGSRVVLEGRLLEEA